MIGNVMKVRMGAAAIRLLGLPRYLSSYETAAVPKGLQIGFLGGGRMAEAFIMVNCKYFFLIMDRVLIF